MERPEVGQEVVIINTHGFHSRAIFGYKVTSVTPKTGVITVAREYTQTEGYQSSYTSTRKFNKDGREVGKDYSREHLSLAVDMWKARVEQEQAQGKVADALNEIKLEERATRYWSKDILAKTIEAFQVKLDEAKALLEQIPNAN